MFTNNFITNFEEALQFITSFNFTEFSFDTETWDKDTHAPSLDITRLEIFGISFCNDLEACYIHLPRFSKDQRAEFFRQLNLKLSWSEEIAGFNLTYDVKVLQTEGIDLTPKEYNWFCVMIARHLVNENSKARALKDVVTEELGVPYNGAKKFGNVWEEYGPESEQFFSYGQRDAEWTYQLYKKYKLLLRAEGVEDLFYKLEMPFLRTIVDMETTGIKLDLKRLESTRDLVEQELLDLEVLLLDSIDYPYQMQTNLFDMSLKMVHDLNFNSTPQMREIIFGKIGVEPTEFTATGNPSLKGEVLKELIGTHPFIEYLSLYRVYSKILGTFIERYLKDHDKDGRIRASFWDAGTVTGRLSCTNPNLQQLPNPKCLKCGNGNVRDGKCVVTTDEDGVTNGCGYNKVPDVRACFIASEGKQLIAADFSQQETIIMAHLSDDENLIKALRMGQDFHLLNANAVFNLGIKGEQLVKGHPDYTSIKTKFQDQRRKGKAFSFKLPYGAQKWAISTDLNCSLDEAQAYLDNYFSVYPGLKAAIDKAHREVDSQGFVRNMLGRKRRFTRVKRTTPWGKEVEEYDDGSYRQSFNFLIQSVGTELIRMSCIKIREYGLLNPKYGINILATIHDEILLECNAQHAQQVSKVVTTLMKSTSNFKVPLGAAADIGDNYSQAK